MGGGQWAAARRQAWGGGQGRGDRVAAGGGALGSDSGGSGGACGHAVPRARRRVERGHHTAALRLLGRLATRGWSRALAAERHGGAWGVTDVEREFSFFVRCTRRPRFPALAAIPSLVSRARRGPCSCCQLASCPAEPLLPSDFAYWGETCDALAHPLSWPRVRHGAPADGVGRRRPPPARGSVGTTRRVGIDAAAQSSTVGDKGGRPCGPPLQHGHHTPTQRQKRKRTRSGPTIPTRRAATRRGGARRGGSGGPVQARAPAVAAAAAGAVSAAARGTCPSR